MRHKRKKLRFKYKLGLKEKLKQFKTYIKVEEPL